KAHQLSRLARRQQAAAQDSGLFYFWFEETLLDDAFAMVGALARELALVRLRMSEWTGADNDDRESSWLDPNSNEYFQRRANIRDEKIAPLSDLLTVLLGMGVFTANTVMIEKNWQVGGLAAGWSARYMGSVSMETYGYALALFASYRGEREPRWAE